MCVDQESREIHTSWGWTGRRDELRGLGKATQSNRNGVNWQVCVLSRAGPSLVHPQLSAHRGQRYE